MPNLFPLLFHIGGVSKKTRLYESECDLVSGVILIGVFEFRGRCELQGYKREVKWFDLANIISQEAQSREIYYEGESEVYLLDTAQLHNDLRLSDLVELLLKVHIPDSIQGERRIL